MKGAYSRQNEKFNPCSNRKHTAIWFRLVIIWRICCGGTGGRLNLIREYQQFFEKVGRGVPGKSVSKERALSSWTTSGAALVRSQVLARMAF